MVPKASKASGLNQEARTIRLGFFISLFVGANFKYHDGNITEAEGEVAFRLVVVSCDRVAFGDFGDKRKLPKPAAEKKRETKQGLIA
jgi:hypothetical protein